MQPSRDSLGSFARTALVLMLLSAIGTYFVLMIAHVVIFSLILLGLTAVFVKMAPNSSMGRLASFVHRKNVVLAPPHMFPVLTSTESEVFTMNTDRKEALARKIQKLQAQMAKIDATSSNSVDAAIDTAFNAPVNGSANGTVDEQLDALEAEVSEAEKEVGLFAMARKSFSEGFSMLWSKIKGLCKWIKDLVVAGFTKTKDGVVWSATKVKNGVVWSGNAVKHVVVDSYNGVKNFGGWCYTNVKDGVSGSYNTVRTWVSDRYVKVWTTFWISLGVAVAPVTLIVIVAVGMYLTLPRWNKGPAASVVALAPTPIVAPEAPVAPVAPKVAETNGKTEAPVVTPKAEVVVVATKTEAPVVTPKTEVAVVAPKTEVPATPEVVASVEAPVQTTAPVASRSTMFGKIRTTDGGIATAISTTFTRTKSGS